MPDVLSARPNPFTAKVRAAEVMDVADLGRVIARILRLAARRPGRLVFAVLASLAATLFAIALPHLLGRAVNEAHALAVSGPVDTTATQDALYWTAAGLVAVSVLRGGLTAFSGYLFESIGQYVAYGLRLDFFEKLQRLDFGFHDTIHSGDLITRGMLDLEGVRMFVENGLQRIVSLVLLLGVGTAAMVAVDPLMTALALSFVPFVVWRAFRIGLVLRFTWTRLQQRMSVLTRTIEENLQGVRVVRAFAARDHELDKFDDAASQALILANSRITIRSGTVATMTFAFYAAMALVLWVGGGRVAAGRMTVGELTAFLTFMTLLQAPVRQVMMVVNTVARAVSSGSRLFEILDRPPRIDDLPGARPLARGDGVLRFENVGFRFDAADDGPAALTGISFAVAPGQTLGIVGAPGSGKSTLAQLIPRFYDVSEGRISIGGEDIRDVSLESLRAAVSLVQQDLFLFDDSVADNIAYADPDADAERIREASARAHLHDHIASLPDAYRTSVGERGIALSGGQRQRLSIARGLLSAPDIVIFDDSTSAVDAATEERLRTDLKDWSRTSVTIIISHRLGSLRHADEIIVLAHGRIAERGTHDRLIAKGGEYARLHAMQSGGGQAALQPERIAS